MRTEVATLIDEEKCTGCGLCIPVCPLGTIHMRNGKAYVAGTRSLQCGHCASACPEEAISIAGLLKPNGQFHSFQSRSTWLPFGEFDIVALHNLMASRRSCRNYRSDPVDTLILEDLVRIGATAPSGTNCQQWSFTIVPDRKSVEAVASLFLRLFKRLNWLASKAWLRFILRLCGNRHLSEYYSEHYKAVRNGIRDWEQSRIDRLFHGAVALMIVGSEKRASTPVEDAMLATQNILLAAHALGLGTCLIGVAVEAMKVDKSIGRAIGIGDETCICSVIAIGHPSERYRTVTARKRVVPHYFVADSE